MYRTGVDVGAASEARFFRIFSNRTDSTPSWFIKVSRATEFMDMRGIDAYAFVYFSERRKRVKVPIQIKSSSGGRWNYYRKNPHHSSVIVVVMRDDKSDEELRNSFFQSLENVRDVKETYIEFFKYIQTIKIREKSKLKLLDLIGEARDLSS